MSDDDFALCAADHGNQSLVNADNLAVATELAPQVVDLPEVEIFVSSVAVGALASAEVIAFPGMQEIRYDDSTKQIGDLVVSLPLYNIYLAETNQLVRHLSQAFAE